MGNYDDIINLSRPVSKHPKMSLYQRSAQFAPFAALSGYEGQIRESRRLTDRRIELDEEMKQKLDLKLQFLEKQSEEMPIVKITYFIPDTKKDGGKYETILGTIRKVDMYSNLIIMMDETRIKINDVFDIECELFNKMIF